MMTVGRGSSSASSVLAEAIRDGNAPAALILQESDEVIVLGSIVTDEMYRTVMPILLVDDATYRDIASLTAAQVSADGQIDQR
jgi:predicted aconitase with swiveling domain